MNIVVGSGPAGVAVASALRAAGETVTIIDGGSILDPDRQAKKARLAGRDPGSWTADDLAFLKPQGTGPGQVPDKHSFGSDYPYAVPRGATPIEARATAIKPSYAKGGLSTVWGSAMLPFRDEDTLDWPISSHDLDEGYRAASKLLPISGARDDLEALFPFHRSPDECLSRSRQVRTLVDTMSRHASSLRSDGLRFGAARLAVDVPGCVDCGLCLHGCPYDLIYSATSTVDSLLSSGASYRSRLVVKAVSESDRGVAVHAVGPDGSPSTIEGTRVFIAAGVLNSTEIMLRSMNRYDTPVSIKDAQYFLVPSLLWRGAPNVARERLNTLCQAFLDIHDTSLSPFLIHLQVYGYNDIIRDLVFAKAGLLANVLPMRAILGRLMVLQGYLHSDHSGTIEVSLRGRGANETLTLAGHTQPATGAIVSGVVRKLGRLVRKTGLSPIAPMVEVTQPGRGFHSGGSFPMHRSPGRHQTDLLGRPNGFSRVHLVDSSVFPSIPATTITFAVMANAHRIGAAVAAGL